MTTTAHFREPHILSDGKCYCTCGDCTDENGACTCSQCQDTTEHPERTHAKQPPIPRGTRTMTTIRRLTPLLILVASALALTGCAATTVSKTPPSSLPTSTAAPATQAAAASPSDSSSLTGSTGTTFTVTTTDDSGNPVSYDVTLDQVVQQAALAPYETLSNSADHAAAAEFTITGDTGQSSDDANNDANAIGSDQTEYQPTFVSLTVPNFSNGDFEVAPGQTEKGWVAFELPPGVKVARVQWAPGLNSPAATWTVSG